MPGIRSVGTVSKVSSGNMSPGLPTGHALNDILVVFTVQQDNVTDSMSGWTNIPAGTGNNGSNNRIEMWAKRDNGAEGAITVTHSAGGISNAVCIAIVGVDPGLSIAAVFRDVQKQTGNNTSTYTAPAVTPIEQSLLLIFGGFSVNDTSGATTNNWGIFSSSVEDLDDCSGLGGAWATSFAIDHKFDAVGASATATVGWSGLFTNWVWQTLQIAVFGIVDFPIVRGSLGVTTDGSTAATNQLVLMPAAVEPGDLLIAALRSDNATDHTWPSPWVRMFFSTADGSDDGLSVAYKYADGSEDGTKVTVVAAGVAGKYAAQSVALFNCADPRVTPPEVTSVATGTSTTPNPPSLTPAGGFKAYKWLALATCEGEQAVNFTEPSGFADFGNASTSGTASTVDTNCRVSFSGMDDFEDTKDPGTWTISVSDDWMSVTMAVYPRDATEFLTPIRQAVPTAAPAPFQEPRVAVEGGAAPPPPDLLAPKHQQGIRTQTLAQIGKEFTDVAGVTPVTDVIAALFQPRVPRPTVAQLAREYADVATPDPLVQKSQPVGTAGKPWWQPPWRAVDVPAPDIVQPKPQPVTLAGRPATQPRPILLEVAFPDIVKILLQPVIQAVTKALTGKTFDDTQPAPPATEALRPNFQPPLKAVLTVAQVEKTLLSVPSPDVVLMRLIQTAVAPKPVAGQVKFLDVQPVVVPDVLARLLQQVPRASADLARSQVRRLVSFDPDVLRPLRQQLQVRPDGTIYQPRPPKFVFLEITLVGEGVYALVTQAGEVYALITQAGEVYANVTQVGELYALVSQSGEVIALVTQSGEIYAVTTRRPN